jgi:hypothetical protein
MMMMMMMMMMMIDDDDEEDDDDEKIRITAPHQRPRWGLRSVRRPVAGAWPGPLT